MALFGRKEHRPYQNTTIALTPEGHRVITIKNHAGEVTTYDLTPTPEDEYIKAFFRGEKVPPEFGTVGPSGNSLVIGNIEERTKTEAPVVIVSGSNLNDIAFDSVLAEIEERNTKGKPKEKPIPANSGIIFSPAAGTSR